MRPLQIRLTVLTALPALLLVVAGCQLLSEEQRRSPSVLLDGKRLNDQHCYQCHYLYEPEAHSDAEWVSIVRDMGRRAQLTPLQSEKLLAWMQWANGVPEDQREAELSALPGEQP